MLVLAATPDQSLSINSQGFAVTEVSPFEARFYARIAPISNQTGCFALIFLGASGEISRVAAPFESSRLNLGVATTDTEGTYTLLVDEPLSETLRVEAVYTGDEEFLPVTAHIITE